MARSAASKPRRMLGALVAIIAVLYALIGAGVLWSNAQWTPKLALDLEGGEEIVLTPRPIAGHNAKITQNTLNQAIDIIRQRVNGNGVSEADVTSQGSNNIIVSIPGHPDQRTLDLVRQAAQLRFRAVLAVADGNPANATPTPTTAPTSTPGSSPSPTASPTGTAKPSAGSTPTLKPAGSPSPSATTKSNGMAIPKGLLRQAGSTPSPSATGSPNAATSPKAAASPSTVATPTGLPATPTAKPTDGSDTNWVTASLGAQFEALDCTKRENLQGGGGDDPNKPLVACSAPDGRAKYILGPAEVLGSDVSSASAGPEINNQGMVTGTNWQVNLNFTGPGTKKFADVTKRLVSLQGVRNQFAIVLDGLVVSAPATNAAIVNGQAVITGNFTPASATLLADQLKFGALPISFEVQTEQHISATLGSEQLQRGLLAGIIGLGLVVLYSLLQYRALGSVTIASLAIAGSITYGLVALMGWRQGYRLSLAGVAGLIVSIGITADSFIVFFERVRDEVRDGRSLGAAVEAAWVRARRTILASDAVSFLAAVVLYALAVGGVRGFAFTLGLTTLVDILVVFMFTKPTVTLLARTEFFGGGHKWSGFDPEHLGRTVVYAGRGRVRGGPTIAERKAAAERALKQGDESETGENSGPDGPGSESEGSSVTPAGSSWASSSASSRRDA